MQKMPPQDFKRLMFATNYPATKEDLIITVLEEGIDENVLIFLAKLPNKSFINPSDLEQEIQQIQE